MRTRAAVTRAASAHIPASDYIPLGTPLTPHVIKLSGTGDYLAIWRLEGITFETADRAEILVRKEALHNFIQNIIHTAEVRKGWQAVVMIGWRVPACACDDGGAWEDGEPFPWWTARRG